MSKLRFVKKANIEVVPEVVLDQIKDCSRKGFEALAESGMWSEEALDMVEEHLYSALADATVKVFTSIKDSGNYPSFT